MIMKGARIIMKVKYGYSIIKDEITFTSNFKSVTMYLLRRCSANCKPAPRGSSLGWKFLRDVTLS
jgi:hypothetical protein